MNHMAEVAKMLGVELYEEFEVPKYSLNKYKIIPSGIAAYDDGKWRSSSERFNVCFLFEKLLAGQYEIKRKPWKPSKGDKYWYIFPDGSVNYCHWTDDALDFFIYKVGNCYRTQEEAEANRDKWVKFYASDEVLEV